MRKYTLIILSTMLLLSSSLVMADDQLTKILEGIRNSYGHLPGLSVAYEREIITKSMALLGETMKTDLASGRFYFKPPHFLKVQQDTPKPETVTTDGRTLWWYIPDKKQAYRYSSDELGKELQVLTDIFRGLRKPEETFEVILTGYDDKERYKLRLTPNPPWQEIQYIDLSVAQDSYTIRVVEIHNYVGGITRFILGDVAPQEKFEEGFFRFVVPEGVKILEE